MQINKLLLFTFICSLFLRCNLAGKNLEVAKMKILDSITGNSYDTRMRPQGSTEDGPVSVKMNIYVLSINHVDDVGMNYKVQLTVRQMWNDNRFVYDDLGGKIKYISLNDLHKIWIPDIFFPNEISAQFHDVITPNVLLRIYPNGNVQSSLRVSLQLSCPMDLRNFPMDNQACSLIIASYGATTEDLVLVWKEFDPVQVAKSLSLPEYSLIKYDTAYCISRTQTGEYSCLRIDFIFRRETQGYMILVYIPNMMFVVIAWLSFWIPQKSALIRAGVTIGSLLSHGSQVGFVNGISIPFASYTKAIDIWSGTCLTFVFTAFVEFIIAHCIWMKKQRRNSTTDFEMKQLVGAENAVHPQEQSNRVQSYWKRADLPHRIDLIFRIFYPVAFGIFNTCYWATYLGASD